MLFAFAYSRFGKKNLNLNFHTIFLGLKHNIMIIKLRWSGVRIDILYEQCGYINCGKYLLLCRKAITHFWNYIFTILFDHNFFFFNDDIHFKFHMPYFHISLVMVKKYLFFSEYNNTSRNYDKIIICTLLNYFLFFSVYAVQPGWHIAIRNKIVNRTYR